MTWDSFVVGFVVASAVSLFARWVERRLSRKLDHARVELIVAQEELIATLIRTVDKAAALLGIEAMAETTTALDDRGTGRTWRQMEALPDGAIFVVAHQGERKHCQHMLTKMGRRSDALNLVVLADAHAAVRSLAPGAKWDIDHFAADMMTAEQAALLAPYQVRCVNT